MPKIWINACEPSADVYASLLIKWFQANLPQAKVMGMGGKLSREAGLEALFQAEQLSIMGLTEVISALPRVVKLLNSIKRQIKKIKPDLLILLDAPDFNFRLAKYARKLNIPVFYYIAPQLWAWRQGRAKFLKKYTNHVFCIFPFEEKFFQKWGCNTSYVGHPLLELLPPNSNQNSDLANVLLLPGSRKKEVESLLPLFNEVGLRLKAQKPDLCFQLIQAEHISLSLLQKFLSPSLNCQIIPSSKRYQAMQKAKLALAASGTVTLECALNLLPTIIAYKVSSLSYFLGKQMIKVPAIGMPNLILGEKVFPEFIQDQANPKQLTQTALELLTDNSKQEQIKTKLKKIKTLLGEKQATPSVGNYIKNFLTTNQKKARSKKCKN